MTKIYWPEEDLESPLASLDDEDVETTVSNAVL